MISEIDVRRHGGFEIEELSDNQLDAVSGGEIDIGCSCHLTSPPSGGGNGLLAFWAGFVHGLTSH